MPQVLNPDTGLYEEVEDPAGTERPADTDRPVNNGKKKSNTGKIIAGIAILAILCIGLVVFGLPLMNGGNSAAVDPTATYTPRAQNATATPRVANPTATERPADPTATARVANPTATASPTNRPADPTATAHVANPTATASPTSTSVVDDLPISEQAKAIMAMNFATATPGPGTGPARPKDESPVMDFPLDTEWKYGHFAQFLNEVNDAKIALGMGPLTSYEAVDKVFVWFLVEEQKIGGAFSVTDPDGNTWYNCNLEYQDGCKVEAQDEILVVNDFGRTDVDRSGAVCRPFAEGSTDGGWGIWVCSGDFSTVQGFIYVGANDRAKVEQGADLK